MSDDTTIGRGWPGLGATVSQQRTRERYGMPQTSLSECPECGAAVSDTEKHAEWHMPRAAVFGGGG